MPGIKARVRRADRLYAKSRPQLVRILKDAEQELAKKLINKSDSPDSTFTVANARAYQAEIKSTLAFVEARASGLSISSSHKAAENAYKDTTSMISDFESQFGKNARPTLRLESVASMDHVLNKSDRVLLRRNKNSFRRYGDALTKEFEHVLQVGQATGMSNSEIIDKLITKAAIKNIDAEYLHKGMPQSFPKPTGIVRKQYWAERIVRTEIANAQNDTNLRSMKEAKREFPDIKKKMQAILDNRTAADSIAVHGQVRDLDENFVDGAGREYLKPPARPNDRETIIPWRDEWDETEDMQTTVYEEIPPKKIEQKPIKNAAEKRAVAIKAAKTRQAKANKQQEIARSWDTKKFIDQFSNRLEFNGSLIGLSEEDEASFMMLVRRVAPESENKSKGVQRKAVASALKERHGRLWKPRPKKK